MNNNSDVDIVKNLMFTKIIFITSLSYYIISMNKEKMEVESVKLLYLENQHGKSFT